MSVKEAGVYIHEEWKGMTQPVGLVVEPIVLDRFGIFPERSIKVITDLQRHLEPLFEDQIKDDFIYSSVTNLREFFKEVLNWQDGDLVKTEDFPSEKIRKETSIFLEDYDEILQPDWIVPEFTATDNPSIQILVKELEVGTPFDKLLKKSENKKQWEATPQQRFERLLKETENPIGILWNGVALRLVYAPRGESSGHITFPLEPMLTVDGRPMIAALEMLLGPDRLFEGGSSDLRLKNLMEKSRKEQNEVSTRLSEQVLEALWILLRGFDEAEQNGKLIGQNLLNNLPEKDPSHIYGGLITILLRLVFLLYSEDEELMPNDSLYVQNYSVSGLAARLRNERNTFQNAMENRYGAWGSLLSLFRLVFDGGGPYEHYLPARHGDLFDPDAYPFLEGREINSCYQDGILEKLPLISDDVVEKILNKLLILDGQILSYRSLDVEQIGSIYEGIMGFAVERAKGISLGILYSPPRQSKITFVINAEEFLSQAASKRDNWLKSNAGIDLKLPDKVKKDLKLANNLDDLCLALGNRLSPYTKRGLPIGSLILQPSEERRKTGSHYTPRVLTEPIVEETFRPWLENLDFSPSAKEILDLKVCDPAMGSGAFLVAACRFLSKYLVEAWNKDGLPEEFNESYDKDIYARRLVTQCCLYGVDKNPFAVNLAKLSLWLVTLSKDLPFTFVDHSLKCGDSLIGFSINEIEKANKNVQLGFLDQKNHLVYKVGDERETGFSKDSRKDNDYDFKKELLSKQNKQLEKLRTIGDLMVAAFFKEKKARDRTNLEQEYLSLFKSLNDFDEKSKSLQNILFKLKHGAKGIRPFHWDLEFPEVFAKNNKGFDAFVGNPPFAGNNTFVQAYPAGILDWFKNIHPESGGQCDLVAHFFRRSFSFLKKGGTFGLIATSTIAEGDTRESGLKWICKNDGIIFSALKKYKWPGVASVFVSTIHVIKGKYQGQITLDGNNVDSISAFLTANGVHDIPNKLLTNSNKSFQGSKPYGKGFTFEDTNFADSDSPGSPSPIEIYKQLIKNEKNLEVIFPYIGGEEVSSKPNHSHHKFVIDFRDLPYDECKSKYPNVLDIIEKKVKPERQKLNSDGAFKLRKPLPQKWWIHGEKRPGLYGAISSFKKVLAITQTSKYTSFVFLNARQVFDQKLYVFPLDKYMHFALCQSNIHLIWAYFFGPTKGEGHVYNSSDCFENFPFPSFMFTQNDLENKYNDYAYKLEILGKEYYQLRSRIMIESNLGITKTYNKFHNPKCTDEGILKLRNLQERIDNEIFKSYGWNDLCSNLGFKLDALNIEVNDNLVISDKVKAFFESGSVFFEDINKADFFNSEIVALGNRKKEIPWEYSFSNDVKEKLLGRLIELNQKRYLEEKSKPLKSKNKRISNKIKIKHLYSQTEQNQLGFDL